MNVKKKISRPHCALGKIIAACALCFFAAIRFAYASTPTCDSVTPTTGSTTPNTPTIFTCKYSDAGGASTISEVQFLVGTSSTALSNAAYVDYNRSTGLLYLRNDANTAWLGGYAAGTNNVIENSQVKLNCLLSSIYSAGTTVTAVWSLTFKPAYSGKAYLTYLYVKDSSGFYAGLTQKGAYTVNSIPQVGTVTPSSGSGYTNVPTQFTTTYIDQDGWQNISSVNFNVNTSTGATNCFHGTYDRINNKLYIANIYGNDIGGYAPGSANVIDNSYAALDCAQTSVSGSGTSLTINWKITFKSTFTGAKNTYLTVNDSANGYSGIIQKGTWTINVQPPDTTPPTGSIKINNDATYTNSTAVTLTLSAADTGSGMGAGAQMKFSNDAATWSTAEAYAAAKSWTLATGDGTKTVYAKFKDAAGNWSSSYSDSIVVDTIVPSINSMLPADASTAYENSSIAVSSVVSDTDPSPLEYQVSIDGAVKQAWSSLSTYTWSAVPSGAHSITVEARDAGGSAAKTSQVYIYKQPLAPPN